MTPKQSELKNWIVRMKCEVIKDVYVGPCTREQAETEPYSHALGEDEVDQRDWEVLKVEPNE